MALGDILAAISADSESEIARVGAESAEEVAVVLERGRTRAAAVEDEAARSLDHEAAEEHERIVNRARLQVERRVRAMVEEIYCELRTEAKARLARARDDPGYPKLLRQLFDECRAIVPDARTVIVDPRDRELVRAMLSDVGVDEFRVDPTLETSGGLEIFTEDRRRGVRNTLESRLDRADRHLRSVAAASIPALRGEAS